MFDYYVPNYIYSSIDDYLYMKVSILLNDQDKILARLNNPFRVLDRNKGIFVVPYGDKLYREVCTNYILYEFKQGSILVVGRSNFYTDTPTLIYRSLSEEEKTIARNRGFYVII